MFHQNYAGHGMTTGKHWFIDTADQTDDWVEFLKAAYAYQKTDLVFLTTKNFFK